ncbi:hypothetical protein L917_09521, partial [Phytophthora nicotianae]
MVTMCVRYERVFGLPVELAEMSFRRTAQLTSAFEKV